eukprot:8385086-Prorocentrum_lima.AAC.1
MDAVIFLPVKVRDNCRGVVPGWQRGLFGICEFLAHAKECMCAHEWDEQAACSGVGLGVTGSHTLQW